jgi:DNA-binding transcriptional regulator LsrR (DeoR family)
MQMDLPYKLMNPKQRDLLVGAYLEAGWSQSAIAGIFGCEESTVSGWVKSLRKNRIIHEETRVADYGAELEWVEQSMRSRPHEQKFCDERRIRAGINPDEMDCVVVPANIGNRKPKDSPELRELRLRIVARFAAYELYRYLANKPDAVVGVSFGRSMELMVGYIERIMAQMPPRLSRQFARVKVFNLSPDFGVDAISITSADDSFHPFRYCASSLAVRLALALRTTGLVHNTLPGWIPVTRDATKRDLEGLRRRTLTLFGRYAAWSEIYGESPDAPGGLIRSADLLITGIGSVQSTRTYLALTGWGAEQSFIEASLNNAAGDISSCLLPKSGKPIADLPLALSFIGPTLEDFVEVGKSARKSGHGGVMVLAAGREKSDALDAALGLHPNRLVIDTALCTAWAGEPGPGGADHTDLSLGEGAPSRSN